MKLFISDSKYFVCLRTRYPRFFSRAVDGFTGFHLVSPPRSLWHRFSETLQLFVAYDLRPPSHVGTGNRCRPLKFGFDPRVSATAVDIDDIYNAKASKVKELLEVSEEFCSF